jgi:hypothetical protein
LPIAELSFLAGRQLALPSLVAERESLLALIAEGSGGNLVKNTVIAKSGALFALRCHHSGRHGCDLAPLRLICLLKEALVISEKMLHVRTLPALGVAVPEVVALNISEVLLARDTLVRVIALDATDWAKLTSFLAV